ncbi:MAG: hypothetical protein ABFR05_02405 [Bacteroidota bacterium]
MEVPKIIPENINLFHLNIVESNITDTLQKKDLRYKINIAHTTMHNLKEEKVKIGLLIDIQGEDKENDHEAKAHFNIDFHFQIKDLINLYKLEESKNPIFSGLFISTLLGISYSTARGLIYERLSNTNLYGIVLPVVSPSKILESRVKIN